MYRKKTIPKAQLKYRDKKYRLSLPLLEGKHLLIRILFFQNALNIPDLRCMGEFRKYFANNYMELK